MDLMHNLENNTLLPECHLDDQMWGFAIKIATKMFNKNVQQNDHVLHHLFTLGARGGVPGRYTANTSQGNGQSTHPKPTWYTANTFKIFQANSIAMFPAQRIISTFTVFPVV